MAGRRFRYAAILAVLGALAALFFVLGLVQGAAKVSTGDCITSVLSLLGLADADGVHPIDYRIVVDLRLPRALAAFLIGGSLALAGTCLQTMFRNPMADPGTVGVAAGAAFGAVMAIYAGLAAVSIWAVPGAAFVGAAAITLLVYGLSTREGRTRVALLLLTGMALNFLIAALTALVLYAAFSTEGHEIGRQILLWTMGGLADRTWEHIAVLTPLALVGSVLLLVQARPLNLLLLGEDQASSLGVGVQSLKLQLVVISSLLTAAAVAFAGVIAFVGLVVPHMARLIIGPQHGRLLPVSAIGGGVFLAAADLVARTILSPEQLPLGVVAALIGAPLFLYLLVRAAGQEAWL